MYKPYVEAMKRHDKERDMSRPIARNGEYLDEGVHDVSILGVDYQHFSTDGSLVITLTNGDGSTHKHRVWTVEDDGRISPRLMKFFAALFEDVKNVTRLAELLGTESVEACNLMRGLKVQVALRRSAGYTVSQLGGNYMLLDGQSKEPIVDTMFDTVRAAHEEAERRGLKKSWPRVYYFERTHGNANDASFKQALDTLVKRRPQGAGTDTDQSEKSEAKGAEDISAPNAGRGEDLSY